MPERLRIGELSRRTGVSIERIRIWERRYGVLAPARSPGGFRLYSERDVHILRTMRALVDAGVPASEAARRVHAGATSASPPDESQGPLLDTLRQRLRERLDAWDEAGAQLVLDELYAAFDIETALSAVFLPYLFELGERWSRGEVTVAHEHFASAVLRGRLLSLARGWDRGLGPHLLLACVPGEQHDLPLVIFGVLARRRGWRVTLLGADTPVRSIEAARTSRGRAATVLASTTRDGFLNVASDVRALGRGGPVAIGGRGASEEVAARLSVRLLPPSLPEAADALFQVFPELLP